MQRSPARSNTSSAERCRSVDAGVGARVGQEHEARVQSPTRRSGHGLDFMSLVLRAHGDFPA